jgi:Yip1 domain
VSQLSTQPTLTDRMIRASKLDVALYNEVEADVTATTQALTVVVITALASGIGAALSLLLAGRPGPAIAALIGGIVAQLVGWAIWSWVMYFVGTRLFHGTATYGELLRTLGFAYSPGVFLVLRFIPIVGGLIALGVLIWRLIASFIAIREALDLETGNTIATVIVGVIAYIVVAAIITGILFTLGLGANLASGVI